MIDEADFLDLDIGQTKNKANKVRVLYEHSHVKRLLIVGADTVNIIMDPSAKVSVKDTNGTNWPMSYGSWASTVINIFMTAGKAFWGYSMGNFWHSAQHFCLIHKPRQ